MIPWDEAIFDDPPMQPPPGSVSRAKKLWTTLGVCSNFVLIKGKPVLAVGGKLLLSGPGIIRTAIVGIPWLVVCIIIAMFVGSWFFAGPTITVSSFADQSVDKSGSLGQTIADALALELQRIDQLDTLRNPWSRAEDVRSLWVTRPQAYERVGTINVGSTQLPVGELLLALKALLPHRHPLNVITGSIWRLSSAESTPIRILVRLEEDGRILNHWSSKEAIATDDAAIQTFVKGVAFEVMWSMGRGNEAKSIENFQSYIDGVEKFRRYKDRGIQQDFDEAKTHLAATIADNPQYMKAHYYLGTLYSWRANYDKANMRMTEKYENKASKKYDMLTSQESPDVRALGHFGLGLLAYRHYQREKPVSPSDLELRKADQDFKEAMQQLPFARTGHALVYKEMGCSHRAISEFQRARRSVEGQSSISWIDEQIKALNEQERRAKQAMQKARDGESRWSRLLAVFNWSSAQKGCS